MGWTRLLAHGVPVWDEEYEVFGPEAMLQEVKAMPGLGRAHFAMPPRWLKPVHAIESAYSTMTFAISDPDGSITSNLLKGRAAIFGKEVTIQRWVDKPILVQCSHCHGLGHTKISKACLLAKDSVKCYRCGGPHRSDKHDQECNRKHAVAGKCDCKHFKCQNCLKPGHDCRDKSCPARTLFRQRAPHKHRRDRGKGREREAVAEGGPGEGLPNATLEDILDPDSDMLDPPPLPPNPSGPEIRSGMRDQMIAAARVASGSYSADIDEYNVGGGAPAGGATSAEGTVTGSNAIPIGGNPETWRELLVPYGGPGGLQPEYDWNRIPGHGEDYSPSRPQSGAAGRPMN
jgi:hypothetical protein